jgi:hypothetical protein
MLGIGWSKECIVLAKAAHCESASSVNSYAIAHIAGVIIMLIDEIDTWDIISIMFDICKTLWSRSSYMKSPMHSARSSPESRSLKFFCHVHHHADIVDLFGSSSLWALYAKMMSWFASVALHYNAADRFVQSFTGLFRGSRIGFACPELFQAG